MSCFFWVSNLFYVQKSRLPVFTFFPVFVDHPSLSSIINAYVSEIKRYSLPLRLPFLQDITRSLTFTSFPSLPFPASITVLSVIIRLTDLALPQASLRISPRPPLPLPRSIPLLPCYDFFHKGSKRVDPPYVGFVVYLLFFVFVFFHGRASRALLFRSFINLVSPP